jgi:hypothetical protein
MRFICTPVRGGCFSRLLLHCKMHEGQTEPLARNALDCASTGIKPAAQMNRSVGACVPARVAGPGCTGPLQGRGSRGDAPAPAARAAHALGRGLVGRLRVVGHNMGCYGVPARGFKDSGSVRSAPIDGPGLEPFEFSGLRVSEAGFLFDALPPACGARPGQS